MVFWLTTGILALAVAAILASALLRNRETEVAPEKYDLNVYKDQLREIEQDAARGVIAADEAERLRTEVSRRILAIDAKMAESTQSEGGPRGVGRVAAGVSAVVLLGGAFALYSELGAPGYGDLSLKTRIDAAEQARLNRPSQADAEAQIPPSTSLEASSEYSDLVQKLRGAVAERPNDLQGFMLLARSEAALGNFTAAYAAQERVISLKADSATAEDYADLADMMVLAAGGYVSPEAERVLQAAFVRDENNDVVAYYRGLLMAQTGRPDVALRIWDRLLRNSEATDPWVTPIIEAIPEIAVRAGVTDYSPPALANAPLRGPTQQDMESAANMSAEDRAQMIEGMVAQLAERLSTEGGSPEEWARLIGALAVLGRAEEAMQVYADGQEVFSDNDAALRTLRDAATGAGIGQ